MLVKGVQRCGGNSTVGRRGDQQTWGLVLPLLLNHQVILGKSFFLPDPKFISPAVTVAPVPLCVSHKHLLFRQAPRSLPRQRRRHHRMSSPKNLLQTPALLHASWVHPLSFIPPPHEGHKPPSFARALRTISEVKHVPQSMLLSVLATSVLSCAFDSTAPNCIPEQLLLGPQRKTSFF